MIHILSQLDPMVWLMMVVVAIAFLVSSLVLVDLVRQDRGDEAAPPDLAAADGVRSPDAHPVPRVPSN